ncbi:DUF1801 domain-containing protein [Epilithonimonas lactis]|uniref:YdhG-like domain-containing protein n=1 Tax=Epilithonimonas lactis TaxID=421072 RepID=A0A085BJV1_9FLAO|nr:DUF1801 domain-containing protein [Epilithonimonas lactis]KFC22746.1 hypothetical protein IO89_06750 [Epilithonimonas lactis]SEQ86090.1 protein of unknown function (DU1801) [Epilithonimonas lactis]
MAKNKTTENNLSVDNYINNITDEKRQNDVRELVKIFEATSGFPPKMWGEAIIGFGSYHYKYESGHEGDAPLAGLSNRVAQISLYVYQDIDDKENLFSQLGKVKTAKACIYTKKLEDINIDVLKKIITNSTKTIQKIYG